MYLAKKRLLFIYLFLERGERKEKERERNTNVWLPLAHPLLGTWSTTQACDLTGNQTGDPLLCSFHSIHWPTPVRAGKEKTLSLFFYYYLSIIFKSFYLLPAFSPSIYFQLLLVFVNSLAYNYRNDSYLKINV